MTIWNEAYMSATNNQQQKLPKFSLEFQQTPWVQGFGRGGKRGRGEAPRGGEEGEVVEGSVEVVTGVSEGGEVVFFVGCGSRPSATRGRRAPSGIRDRKSVV